MIGSSYKKDYGISYCRLLATLMIVCLHTSQHMETAYPAVHILTDWLNYGVIFFFCISALLYSKRDIGGKQAGKWILHRYKELVVPSMTVVFVVLLLFACLGKFPSQESVFGSLMAGFALGAFPANTWMFAQYWFLTYILFCYITIPLIGRINWKMMNPIRFWGGGNIQYSCFSGRRFSTGKIGNSGIELGRVAAFLSSICLI